MAIEVSGEKYSPAWQGVIYDAIFFERRYPCLVAIHHLKMKVGKEAVGEFRARIAEVEHATEAKLLGIEPQIERGRRKLGERIIVPLDASQGW